MSAVESRTGDCLVEIFREQRAALWGFFSGKLAREAAEDLLQETFLKTWDHRESLTCSSGVEEKEAARKYLWRVARNLVIDEIRLKVRRGDPLPLEDHMSPAMPGPSDEVEMADALRAVRESVNALTNERARRCLQLWLEGLELNAIGKELSMGLHQVRGLLQRGRCEVILRAGNRLRAHPLRPVESAEERP